MNNKTKVVCPQCGAEFAIPETTGIGIGVVIGADSNLGTIYPTVVGQTKSKQTNMKAEAKLEALRKAGINVDNLFSMKGANGVETIARVVNGHVSVISDDDPIFAAINAGGTVNNPKLYRRWVMAQVFHMLATGDFCRALQWKGYHYQWKMLVEELRVQAKLFHNDPENFAERNLYFDKDRVSKICHDYLDKLKEHLEELKKNPRHCKGVPYIRIKGKNIFCDDIYSKILSPLYRALGEIERASNPDVLYNSTGRFYSLVKRTWMNWSIQMAAAFKDSYKGAGAYFTMKNMILFHGSKFRAANGRFMSKDNSLAYLSSKAKEYRTEGWRLFGVMKKLIADNGINIEQKIAEWRK